MGCAGQPEEQESTLRVKGETMKLPICRLCWEDLRPRAHLADQPTQDLCVKCGTVTYDGIYYDAPCPDSSLLNWGASLMREG